MKTTTLIILIITTINLHAQKFSGEIEYKISFIAKNDVINIDSIKSTKYGTKAIYMIKDGYYKNTLYKDNKPNYSYTYENITKRMYDEDLNREFLTFRNSQKGDLDPFTSNIYKDSIIKFLGRKCFIVTYKEGNTISTTYYSKRIKVDYESFENHKVGNWYDKLKEVDGSIGLKTITEYDDYIIIYEAINIKKRNVKRHEFALPKDKMVVASYSALDKNVELSPPNQNQLKCYFDKIKKVITEKSLTKPFTSNIRFVVTKNGELKFIKAAKKDENEIYKEALDIFKNCKFKFIPGQINNSPVSSLTFMPITFE